MVATSVSSALVMSKMEEANAWQAKRKVSSPRVIASMVREAFLVTMALLRRMLIQFRENAANHSPKEA